MKENVQSVFVQVEVEVESVAKGCVAGTVDNFYVHHPWYVSSTKSILDFDVQPNVSANIFALRKNSDQTAPNIKSRHNNHTK